jgi:hypothetical protein
MEDASLKRFRVGAHVDDFAPFVKRIDPTKAMNAR